MRIGTNVAAIVANNALQKSQNNLSTSIERLSSGYKINGSKDDAAGCAISEKMRVQLRGLSQSDNNVTDGISVLNTAEGGLIEIQSMLTRMKELSVQAANDVNSDDERSAIQGEIDNINKARGDKKMMEKTRDLFQCASEADVDLARLIQARRSDIFAVDSKLSDDDQGLSFLSRFKSMIQADPQLQVVCMAF